MSNAIGKYVSNMLYAGMISYIIALTNSSGMEISAELSDEQPDAGCEIDRWKEAAKMPLFLFLPLLYLQRNYKYRFEIVVGFF